MEVRDIFTLIRLKVKKSLESIEMVGLLSNLRQEKSEKQFG
jgi:hypothetical protein